MTEQLVLVKYQQILQTLIPMNQSFIIVSGVLILIITILIVLLVRQYIKNKRKRMYVPPRQSLLESQASDSYMIPMSGIPMTPVGISNEEEEEDVLY